ncbi:hypothetical protein LIER_09519 [Lithospermum erythrorhizon]|uniref:CCHC-type domain-containing protein n=1 Tax=Lithospermum erythrorhizon TaxID=34254 RepID=A0AAV3PG10_LITER
MIGIASLEEQMVALKGMVENLLQKIQHQDDSIAQLSRKIADQEHRARAAEVALKQKEAPMTSGMGYGTSHLSPHRALGSSHGPTRNAIETPIIPIDGMIPTLQFKEYILGAIKDALLILQHWTSNIVFSNFDISHINLWIQIHGIPAEYFEESNVRRLARVAGDIVVDGYSILAQALHFVRVKVFFRYETISRACYHCGHIGHSLIHCRHNADPALNHFLEHLQNHNFDNNYYFFIDYDSPLYDQRIRAFPNTDVYRNTTIYLFDTLVYQSNDNNNNEDQGHHHHSDDSSDNNNPHNNSPIHSEDSGKTIGSLDDDDSRNSGGS